MVTLHASRKRALTLIELLMVLAIIGLLASTLLPLVGTMKQQANIAASKSQLMQYVQAIQLFKGEYGYYPFTDAQMNSGVNINTLSNDFIETLSGRDATSGKPTSMGGNRRSIAFHSFAAHEFYLNPNGEIDPTQIADRFNNTAIFIVIDGDGDGIVTVPVPFGSETAQQELRAAVTAYVAADPRKGCPRYYLYD
jgi:prepilin-type N-terminal cleavage/methylation domain-containing protein